MDQNGGVLVVFTNSIDDALANIFNDSGLIWKAIGAPLSLSDLPDVNEWIGAVVCAQDDPEGALHKCRSLREHPERRGPILLLTDDNYVEAFIENSEFFDDLLLRNATGAELRARLNIARRRLGDDVPTSVIDYDAVSINLVTYQALVNERTLDMTYMEYKLLKYFVLNCDRVLDRQELLKDVWGYEYFGGARTVDVHVRRLRAKLGEENAYLIQTIRSVGYMFSRDRWES